MSAPKKVLFTAHVDSHILAFHTPYLKDFKDKGYEVHVASHGDAVVPHTDVKYDVPIERSPLKLNNLRAIRQLREIIDRENYDIIHTHTPMGSVVTRLAAMTARKKGTRVIYTAHGFHFFKGAPLLNWLIYYPIEKLLAHQTDDLITINNEDYERATAKFKTRVHYVPGVGIDPKKFDVNMSEGEKTKLRESLRLKDDDFVMIYVAELSKRKNQMWLVKTLEEMMKKDRKVHLLLPGKDSLNGKLHDLVKELGLQNQVHLLGFRSDIPQLMKISDMAVSAAKQEGLPVNLMEAMYLGLPIVASDCRGNRDLIANQESGRIVTQEDSDGFMQAIDEARQLKADWHGTLEPYLLSGVQDIMEGIYQKR